MASLLERVQATQLIIGNVKKVMMLQLQDPSCRQSKPYHTNVNNTLLRAKMDTIIAELNRYEQRLIKEGANPFLEMEVERDSHQLMQAFKDLLQHAETKIREIQSLPPDIDPLKEQLFSIFNVFHANIDQFFKPQATLKKRKSAAGARPMSVGKHAASFHAVKLVLDGHQRKMVAETVRVIDSLATEIPKYSKKYGGSGFDTILKKYPVDLAALKANVESLASDATDVTSVLEGLNRQIEETLKPLEKKLQLYASGVENYGIPPGCAAEAKEVFTHIEMFIKQVGGLKPSAPTHGLQ